MHGAQTKFIDNEICHYFYYQWTLCGISFTFSLSSHRKFRSAQYMKIMRNGMFSTVGKLQYCFWNTILKYDK